MAAALIAMIGAFAWSQVPPPEAWLAPRSYSTVLADREGHPLRVLLADDGQDARWIPCAEMGPWLGPALIAAEDGRFYRHRGVDLWALVRATAQNVFAGRVVSGASTISMQVVRLARPRPRTLAVKLIEALMALKMERTMTKERILEEYVNRAPFGGPYVGARAAARHYFGCDVRDLTLGEAALLAGLPQSPARLRPDRHLDRARQRRNYVLERMARRGFINEAQRIEAQTQPLTIEPDRYPLQAPHFAEAARHALTQDRRGRLVRTTLDPDMQRLAEDALGRAARRLRADGVYGGAVVVLDVPSGAVRALVGSPNSRDPRVAGHVNAAMAPRSAGSTLKPLLFALAFDEGRLTPATVLADVPRVYSDYRPANFDGEFRGLVPARVALSDSLNMPALDLAHEMGVARLHRGLLDFGLRTLSRPTADYGLGLALGNGEVTLLDLAGAYAALARGGVARPAIWFEGETSVPGAAVVSSEAAWLVSEILSDPSRTIPGAGPPSAVRSPRAAWKTGTSSGFRDAWTVAWNPDVVVAVWMGNPEGIPSPALVGGAAAAPVAWDIFRGLYPRGEGPWFPRPEGIEEREVCAVSGRACGPYCAIRTPDWTIAGASRHAVCTVHRAGRGEDPPEIVEVWPDDVAAFLARGGTTPSASATASAPRIVSPLAGAPYRRWAPEEGQWSRVPLIAETRETDRLWWFVDGRALGSARPGDPIWWTPEPGHHVLVCSDAAGCYASIGIQVE
jgi:penicillin-binding protein 1C